jgi:hypothetical protein
MITIAYNIGYDHEELGGRILSTIPQIFITTDIKVFTDFIRESVYDLIEWANVHHVPKSTLCLLISIREDDEKDEDMYWCWEFKVRLKNVREYKSLLKSKNQIL